MGEGEGEGGQSSVLAWLAWPGLDGCKMHAGQGRVGWFGAIRDRLRPAEGDLDPPLAPCYC